MKTRLLLPLIATLTGALPFRVPAAIIPVDLNQNLSNGLGGPAMSLILTVGDADLPASTWKFNPHVIDPTDGTGFMDSFFLTVASGADGGTGDMSLSESNFSFFFAGNSVSFFGTDPLSYAADANGTPQGGLIREQILWTAITNPNPTDNHTPFNNDLGLALWWADTDQDNLVTPGDQIHILGMVYSTGTDLVSNTTANDLTLFANISPIPEPATFALLGICGVGLFFLRRSRGG